MGSGVMSPDDVAVVSSSWGELRPHHEALVSRLAVSLRAVSCPVEAERRAGWLVDSVAELVGLLAAPSRLGHRARQLAATWPDPCSAPSFHLDGRAWISAARDVCPTWTVHCERAWCQAWLLLSDVLAEESRSPFATPSQPGMRT